MRMLVRLLSRQLPTRSIALRFYATSLKEYETLYDVMEIDPSASKTEVRESWLRLSMMYHPDLNKDSESAREMFIKIKDAYKILNDDKERQAYNDKIGWRHQDPPPDFESSWTLQGEKDRMAAREYSMFWDEERIQALMSSERLREVNWKDKAPSERYRILLEEEQQQHDAKEEDFIYTTPPMKQLKATYLLVGGCVFLLACLAYRLDTEDQQEHMKIIREKQNAILDDVILPNGTLIRHTARYDPHLGSTQEFLSMRKIRENIKAQKEAKANLESSSQATLS